MYMLIAVVGCWQGGSRTAQALAEEVGREIARRGAVVVTGGGPGIMEAASRGAKAEGGLTLGLLPGLDLLEANPYVDIALPTGTGFEIRSALAIRASRAVIVIGGGNGTLGEITMSYLLYRPIVVLRGSGGWADRLPSILYEGQYLDERKNAPVHFAVTPKECVSLALALAGTKLWEVADGLSTST